MPLTKDISTFLQGAEANFKKDGYLLSVLISFGERTEVIACPFHDVEDKDVFEQFLLDRLATGKTTEFVFLSETWIARQTDGAEEFLREHGSLENFPGREEAAIAVHSCPDEEVCYTASIQRGDDVRLDEWVSLETKTPFNPFHSQRFGALWQRAKAGSN